MKIITNALQRVINEEYGSTRDHIVKGIEDIRHFESAKLDFLRQFA